MSQILPIIQPNELLKLDPETFILFDASAGSRARYNEYHLQGAIYIDLETDLANIKDFASGGRHPLPSSENFVKTLQKFGVGEDSHVIIYDDKNLSNAAARFWWMLTAMGHQKVQVLNGGLDSALKAGFPVSGKEVKTVTVASESTYPVHDFTLPIAEINEVETASKNADQTIIDVRSKERFDGVTEPIDLIAGHIPNAINIPFTENLNAEGLFLDPATLKAKYQKLLPDFDPHKTIVHCGSGVTACHTLLAMAYAGLEIPKLYVGSWSEWSRNEKDMVCAS